MMTEQTPAELAAAAAQSAQGTTNNDLLDVSGLSADEVAKIAHVRDLERQLHDIQAGKEHAKSIAAAAGMTIPHKAPVAVVATIPTVGPVLVSAEPAAPYVTPSALLQQKIAAGWVPTRYSLRKRK